MYWSTIDSPLGTMWLTGDGAALTGLYMERPAALDQPGWVEDDAPFAAARDQLAAYFAGERQDFDLPLSPVGTPFQQQVWAALRAIPYGETRSYREIAEQLGRPTASRAVGAANGRNPISVIVPCHRVVGSSGVLTGYAWGLERKRALLDLESTDDRLPAPPVVA